MVPELEITNNNRHDYGTLHLIGAVSRSNDPFLFMLRYFGPRFVIHFIKRFAQITWGRNDSDIIPRRWRMAYCVFAFCRWISGAMGRL